MSHTQLLLQNSSASICGLSRQRVAGRYSIRYLTSPITQNESSELHPEGDGQVVNETDVGEQLNQVTGVANVMRGLPEARLHNDLSPNPPGFSRNVTRMADERGEICTQLNRQVVDSVFNPLSVGQHRFRKRQGNRQHILARWARMRISHSNRSQPPSHFSAASRKIVDFMQKQTPSDSRVCHSGSLALLMLPARNLRRLFGDLSRSLRSEPGQDRHENCYQSDHGGNHGAPIDDAGWAQCLTWPQSLNPAHIYTSTVFRSNSDMEKTHV